MEDKQTGIAIRFIREFDVEAAKTVRLDVFANRTDAALMLAQRDPRPDVPFADRFADAMAFLAREDC